MGVVAAAAVLAVVAAVVAVRPECSQARVSPPSRHAARASVVRAVQAPVE